MPFRRLRITNYAAAIALIATLVVLKPKLSSTATLTRLTSTRSSLYITARYPTVVSHHVLTTQ